MPQPPLVIDDSDCMLTVTLRADGQEVTQQLDLGLTVVELGAVSKKAGQDNVAWLQGVIAWLQGKGFPKCSFTSAKRFWDGVNAAFGELKKKDGA